MRRLALVMVLLLLVLGVAGGFSQAGPPPWAGPPGQRESGGPSPQTGPNQGQEGEAGENGAAEENGEDEGDEEEGTGPPPTPPGRENLPPGLRDKGTPPGLVDKGGLPPGLQGREMLPPGIRMRFWQVLQELAREQEEAEEAEATSLVILGPDELVIPQDAQAQGARYPVTYRAQLAADPDAALEDIQWVYPEAEAVAGVAFAVNAGDNTLQVTVTPDAEPGTIFTLEVSATVPAGTAAGENGEETPGDPAGEAEALAAELVITLVESETGEDNDPAPEG